MLKHLNNKGYMLVEIVLAFVLAMVVMYFVTDLTIKLKNKNDDLLVKTLVSTDQAIIYNAIMRDLYSSSEVISCDYVKNKMKISNNIFEYESFKNIVSDYAVVGTFICNDIGVNSISLEIPIEVKQLPDEEFDIVINFDKKI